MRAARLTFSFSSSLSSSSLGPVPKASTGCHVILTASKQPILLAAEIVVWLESWRFLCSSLVLITTLTQASIGIEGFIS